MRYVIASGLIVAAIIHLMHLSGVIGEEQLNRLYGVSFDEPNLAILMRHRAVLFGLLGVLLVIAAFNPAYQPIALVAGLVSVVSFLWFAASASGYNGTVRRVVVADVVALVALVIAAIAFFLERRG